MRTSARRGAVRTNDSAVEVERSYDSPTSVDGLPHVLLQLAQDLFDDYTARRLGILNAVSAQFEGVGNFRPVRTRVLPIEPPRTAAQPHPSPYVSLASLTAVAMRELLYTTLYALLLDALASEHGMRLLAAESARQWLDEEIQTARHQLIATRREAATQEVLDIAAGARRQRPSP